MQQDQPDMRSSMAVSLRDRMGEMDPFLFFQFVLYSSPLETLERIMQDDELDHFGDTRDTLIAQVEALATLLGSEADQMEPEDLLERVLSCPMEVLERTWSMAKVRQFTEQRERVLALLEEERALLLTAMRRPPQPPRVRDHMHIPVTPTEGKGQKVYCLICTKLLYRIKKRRDE